MWRTRSISAISPATLRGRASRAFGGMRTRRSSIEDTPMVPSISFCWAGVFEMYRIGVVRAQCPAAAMSAS